LPSTTFHFYVAADDIVLKLHIHSFWNLSAFIIQLLQITL